MDYEQALARVVDWASEDGNIRGVVLTGSAAAGAEHPLSDRDVQLLVRDARPLMVNDDWWKRLGDVLVVEKLENANNQPTRLIYYIGGKIDFTLVEVGEFYNSGYDRPFKVLLDKDPEAHKFSHSISELQLPEQDEFEECLNWAYAAALMCAKSIVRDEPWSVKIRDQGLKEELLRVIEWDHVARYGKDIDVHYLGTRLRSWMDVEVQSRLAACWAPFNPAECKEPLILSVELFAEISARVANVAGLKPFDHEKLRTEIDQILSYDEPCDEAVN